MVDLLTRAGAPLTIGGGFAVGTVAAEVPAEPYTPLTLEPVAWFDASTLTDANNTALAQWDDASGNDLHLAQATGTRQPLVKTNIIGDKSVVRFDGSNDYLSSLGVGAAMADAIAAGTFTVAGVMWYHTEAFGDTSLAFSNTGNSTPYVRLNSSTSGDLVWRTQYAGDDGGPNVIRDSERSPMAPTVIVWGQTGIAADSVMTQHLNGTVEEVAFTDVGDAATVNNFSLGSLILAASASGHANLDVAELILIPRVITATERADLTLYLRDKWGFVTTTITDKDLNLFLEPSGAVLVSVSDINTASQVREPDEIMYDPADPDASRRWKFYFSAMLQPADQSSVFGMFSPDGSTWSAPVLVIDQEGAVEDPSVVQRLDTPGTIHRDGDGNIHMYCEVGAYMDLFVSDDNGVTFTSLGHVLSPGADGTYDENQCGSPVARHDGTNYIVAYEGLPGTGYNGDVMALASGTDPAVLTKSANNPVWTPLNDPTIRSVITDSMFIDGDEMLLIGHTGNYTSTSHRTYRAWTSETTPLTWVDTDIVHYGVSMSLRMDPMVDWSSGLTRIVLGDHRTTPQNLLLMEVWKPPTPAG